MMKFGWLIGAVMSLLVAGQAQALSVVYTGTTSTMFTRILAPDFDGPVTVTAELFGGFGDAQLGYYQYYWYDEYADFGDGWQYIGGNDYIGDILLPFETVSPGNVSATIVAQHVYTTIDEPNYYRYTIDERTPLVWINGYDPADPVRYRVTFHGIVPEPATWALMLIGFGMTGALVRRKARCVRRLA